MLPTLSPNVARFEKAVSDKQYETACVELLRILEKIDDNFGGIQDIEFAMPVQIARLEKDQMIYFCTRMAAAITVLFSDPALEISKSGAQQFFALQRWLAVIFASSPYVNADHILQKYNQNPDKTSLEVLLRAEQSELIKFCILYFPESNLVLDLNALWEILSVRMPRLPNDIPFCNGFRKNCPASKISTRCRAISHMMCMCIAVMIRRRANMR